MRKLVVVLIAGLALAPAARARHAQGLTRDLTGARPGAAGQAHPEADIAKPMIGGGLGYSVSYGGGSIISWNRTHIIFWQPKGSGLTFDPGYRPLVGRFMTDVALASHRTSNVFGVTGQYTNNAGQPAAYASSYAGSVLDIDRLPLSGCTAPLPPTAPGWKVCLTDAQLQTEIEHVVQAHHLPTTAHDVYFLLTPRGLGSCMGTSPNSGCSLGGPATGYCGYHRYTNDDTVDYAYIPYNAVPGHCQSNHPRPNGNSADPALSTISHELSESVTDPKGDAWTDGSGNEIGDLCITTFGRAIGGAGSRRYNETIAGGHFYLQEEWSNASERCEPRVKPDHASFVVTQQAGQTLTFKASASDPNGRILSYHWTFGPGVVAEGRSVRHTFPKSGSYSVQLRVTDSWDNWGFYTRTVPVA